MWFLALFVPVPPNYSWDMSLCPKCKQTCTGGISEIC